MMLPRLILALSLHHVINCAHSWPTLSKTGNLHTGLVRSPSYFSPALSLQRNNDGYCTVRKINGRRKGTEADARTVLSMGFLDSISDFLNNRDGDFIKLDKGEKEFGPGPTLILYDIPNGIDFEEIQDMLADGAPKAYSKGVKLFRLFSAEGIDDDKSKTVLDMTIEQALKYILSTPDACTNQGDEISEIVPSSLSPTILSSSMTENKNVYSESVIPVLFFSGFLNNEMMSTYNIIGKEIYEETGGIASPACAKVVPNSMKKSLRQVLEEISGDHQNALSLNRESPQEKEE